MWSPKSDSRAVTHSNINITMKTIAHSTTKLIETIVAHVDFEKIGLHVLRFGLVLVLLWIGGMKFTQYEAEGIKPFVENSPLMSFAYQFLSVREFSAWLGVVEILVGIAIALYPWFPKASSVGSLLAAGMFLTTLSFMLTTPGIFEPLAGGFPALSFVGAFVLKDLALLGASLISLGDALKRSLER